MIYLYIFVILICFQNCSAEKAVDNHSDSLKTHFILQLKIDLDRSFGDAAALLTIPAHGSIQGWETTAALLGTDGILLLCDQPIRKFVQARRSNALDQRINPWQYYGAGYTGVSLGTGIYALGLGFNCPRWRETGSELLVALTMAALTTEVLKIGCGRSRPYTDKGPYSFEPVSLNEDLSSFPSGHTTVAFAVSSVLSSRISNPFASIGLYAIAAATASQRVYGDKHWLSDTFLGAVIGTSIGRYIANRNKSGLQTKNASCCKPLFNLVLLPNGLAVATVF